MSVLFRSLVTGQAQPYEVAAGGGTWLSRRRLWWGGGAVAAALVVGITGMEYLAAPAQQIPTAVGEIRRVPLSDGSLAAVNTQTSLAVTMQPQVREIATNAGEAWIHVYKARGQPLGVDREIGGLGETASGRVGSGR